MATAKGMSEIIEHCRGFVGNKPYPEFDRTRTGKSRVKFMLGCGKPDEANGRYSTWRYCVGYGRIADIDLSDLKVGDWVKVIGWLTTEAVRDETGRFVLSESGRVKTRETVVISKAEILERERKPLLQPELISV